jgi:hypothetical protein
MNQLDFLAGLAATIARQRHLVAAEFAPLTAAQLNQRPAPASWSALECLEHLNRYSRYYNAALATAYQRPDAGPTSVVGYSWLGRYSIALLQPTNPKKQTTLRRMNPLGSRLGPEVITEFDQHQARLAELLALAGPTNLNRRAVPVEFFRLLKLRLGEALEFVVVHQQRHLQQAQRALAAQ